MPQAALLNRRHRFTAEEDEALRKWVAKHPGCKPQGHHLWQAAESAGITVHPWQSMRERWRKKVEPRQPLRPGLRSAWLEKDASKKRKLEVRRPSLLEAPAPSSDFLPKRHKASDHLVVHQGEDGLMTSVEAAKVVPAMLRTPSGQASSSRSGVVVSRALPKVTRRVGSLLLQATQAAAARSKAVRAQQTPSLAATASDVVVPPSDPIQSLFEDTGSDIIQSASLNIAAPAAPVPAQIVEESPPPAAVEKAADTSSGSDRKPDGATAQAVQGSKRWRTIRVDESSSYWRDCRAPADTMSTEANPQEHRPPLPPPAETPSQQSASVGASAEIPAAQPYTQTCDTPGSQTLAIRLEEHFLPYQGETMTYRTDVCESQPVESNAALEGQPSTDVTMTCQSDAPCLDQGTVGEEVQTTTAQAAEEIGEEPSQSDHLVPMEIPQEPQKLPLTRQQQPSMEIEEQSSVGPPHAAGEHCGVAEVMESLLRQDEFDTLALMMELGAASPLETDLRAEVEQPPSPPVVIISSSSDAR
mmetsp:Transcript_44860/g.81829  ORF Transcript_44860/g.81829 Transcript_44860/m.81829 type:complete len:528 (+) Transcript_44860:44-1627(+)